MLETQGIQVQFLSQEDPLEKERATHSSVFTWGIPCTEEPGGLQSTGHNESDRMEHVRARAHTHTSMMESSNSLKPRRKHPGFKMSVCPLSASRALNASCWGICGLIFPGKQGDSDTLHALSGVVCTFVKGACSGLTRSSHWATPCSRLRLVTPNSEDSLWTPGLLHGVRPGGHEVTHCFIHPSPLSPDVH